MFGIAGGPVSHVNFYACKCTVSLTLDTSQTCMNLLQPHPRVPLLGSTVAHIASGTFVELLSSLYRGMIPGRRGYKARWKYVKIVRGCVVFMYVCMYVCMYACMYLAAPNTQTCQEKMLHGCWGADGS